jgi:hypothetical protein
LSLQKKDLRLKITQNKESFHGKNEKTGEEKEVYL